MSEGPTPEVINPRRPPQWRRLGLVGGLGLILAGAATGWWLTAAIGQLRSERSALAQREAETTQELKELQQKYDGLTREHQQLTADRDNLVAQFQRASHQGEQTEKERDLLEQVFRRATAQRLELERRLTPLEEEHQQVLTERDALAKELDQLREQLAKAQARSHEQQLKDLLSKEQHERKKLGEALREAQRKAGRFEAQQGKVTAEFAKLQEHYGALQGKYAQLLLDNRTLRQQSSRVPGDVTKLAREHERLIKDLADTHYNMGVLFTKKKDYVRATKEFRRVIELRPDDADAHYNLGVIYAEHLPDRDKAREFFRRYLALSPRGQDAGFAKQYIATWQAWEGKERLE